MPKTQKNRLPRNCNNKWIDGLYELLCWIDGRKLWWTGTVLFVVVMIPHIRLGEGSVFVVHDQLDESMMNYVLTARHFGEDIIPEMLGGSQCERTAAFGGVVLASFYPYCYSGKVEACNNS